MTDKQPNEAEQRRRRVIITAAVGIALLWLVCLIQSSMPFPLTVFALVIVTTPIVVTANRLANKAETPSEWTPDGVRPGKGRKLLGRKPRGGKKP